MLPDELERLPLILLPVPDEPVELLALPADPLPVDPLPDTPLPEVEPLDEPVPELAEESRPDVEFPLSVLFELLPERLLLFNVDWLPDVVLFALPVVGRSTIPEFVDEVLVGDEGDVEDDDDELGESSSESLVERDPALVELRPGDVPVMLGLVELPDVDCDVPVVPEELSPSSSSAFTVHGDNANATTMAVHNGARLIGVSEMYLLLIVTNLRVLENNRYPYVPYLLLHLGNTNRYDLI